MPGKSFFVSVNMASSIDGKIATKRRGPVKLGSSYDSRRMEEIRAKADAVLIGARTFLAHPYVLGIRNKKLLKGRTRRACSEQPITVVVSSNADFPQTPFEKGLLFGEKKINARSSYQNTRERWLICGKNAAKARIDRLKKSGVRVFVVNAARPSAKNILSILKKQGVKRLLLEGGGELNASFFEKNLVDRIYLTLCPILLGGRDAPSIFEGNGFPMGKFSKYHLKKCQRIHDELYLIFDR